MSTPFTARAQCVRVMCGTVPTCCTCCSPEKDVDGFGADHLGALAGGVSRAAIAAGSSAAMAKPFVPCTAAGIMELLNHYSIPVSGKQVVIIGRSAIVGMPAQLLFMKRNATVNACDIHTPDLASRVAQADILVVAAGSAHLVKGHWVKPGAVVVDVGINFDKTGKCHRLSRVCQPTDVFSMCVCPYFPVLQARWWATWSTRLQVRTRATSHQCPAAWVP